jgi:hypothetical protein
MEKRRTRKSQAFTSWRVQEDFAEIDQLDNSTHGASALGESQKSRAYALHGLGFETTAEA